MIKVIKTQELADWVKERHDTIGKEEVPSEGDGGAFDKLFKIKVEVLNNDN